MANARDIIPIALAGLGGLIGGRPTAGAITNAAQISRAGRLDKQREEQLAVSNARSARSLELSEEAAKRAEKGMKLAETRESRYAADQAGRDKKLRESEALLAKGKTEWLEGHPDATDEQKYGLSLMTTPAQVYNFDRYWADKQQTKTLEEAKLTARELGPGQRVSIRLEDGGTFSASGGTTPEGQGIPGYQIQNRFKDGEREFKRDMDRERVEIAKEQDAINKMMSDEDVGNDKEASERNRQLMERREIFEYDFSQGPWGHIRRELGSLGLSQQGMAEMEQGYHTAIEERQRERDERRAAASQPGRDVLDVVELAQQGRAEAGLETPRSIMATGSGIPQDPSWQLNPEHQQILKDTLLGSGRQVRDLVTGLFD